jgi:hypothetical protein
MKFALTPTIAGAFILGLQVGQPAAQTNSRPIANDLLKFSEQDKTTVIAAVIEAKSRQKTPKEFTPAVGASVPKTVYVHAFNPEIVGKVPTLRRVWYAYLDREIVLIDAAQRKVVAVIPLPEKLLSDDQTHQGAAEPASSKGEHGNSNTQSVPSHTSPESIK